MKKLLVLCFLLLATPAMAAQYDSSHTGATIDGAVTSIGIGVGESNLGTFTGSTIPDSQTVKAALQALETAVETKAPKAPLTVEVTATGSLSDAQVERSIVSNYGMAAGGDTTLPAYAGRTTFTIITEAASQAWSLKPPSGEAFVLDGTALDADDEIDIGQVAGDSGVLIRIRTGASAYQWHFRTISGTHSDGGAS